jgi:hypothetical protein
VLRLVNAGRAGVARRRLSRRPCSPQTKPRIRQGVGCNIWPNRPAISDWPQARKNTLMRTIKTLVAALPTATAAVVLIAGCSNHDTSPPAPSPSVQASPSSSSAPSQAPSAPPTVTVTVSPTASPAPSQSPSTPAALGPCSDSDLEVTNGPLESAKTLRRVVVSFRNTSSHPCTLIGYPGADLVTPGGGVLINVSPRPAAAAHHLTLDPGDVATADVQAYAIEPLPETRARAGATWSSPRPTTTYRTRLASISPFATRLSAQWTDTYLLALNCG